MNHTLRDCFLSERAKTSHFCFGMLRPVVIAGQIDVFPFQRGYVLGTNPELAFQYLSLS